MCSTFYHYLNIRVSYNIFLHQQFYTYQKRNFQNFILYCTDRRTVKYEADARMTWKKKIFLLQGRLLYKANHNISYRAKTGKRKDHNFSNSQCTR